MLLHELVTIDISPETLTKEYAELKSNFLTILSEVLTESVVNEDIASAVSKFKSRFSKKKDDEKNDPKGREEEKFDTSSMMDMIDGVGKRFQAAKKGMGLVNKFKGDERKKHARRVMQNMNALRQVLKKIQAMIDKAYIKV